MDCPTCGQPLPHFEKPIVDLPTNVLLIDGQFVRLAPREAEVLSVILEHMPRVCAREYIFDRIYRSQNDADLTIINAYISFIRRKTAHTRLRIKTIYCRGVQAVLVDPPQAAAGASKRPRLARVG